MNKGIFFTFFKEITPCQIPPIVAFTLSYIDNLRNRYQTKISMEMPHIVVTK